MPPTPESPRGPEGEPHPSSKFEQIQSQLDQLNERIADGLTPKESKAARRNLRHLKVQRDTLLTSAKNQGHFQSIDLRLDSLNMRVSDLLYRGDHGGAMQLLDQARQEAEFAEVGYDKTPAGKAYSRQGLKGARSYYFHQGLTTLNEEVNSVLGMVTAYDRPAERRDDWEWEARPLVDEINSKREEENRRKAEDEEARRAAEARERAYYEDRAATPYERLLRASKDPKKAEEIIEGEISTIEEDDARLESPDQLIQTINQALVSNPELRFKLAEKAYSRLYLHIAAYYAKYVGVGKFSEVLTTFNQRHVVHIIETKGVKTGLQVFAAKDYYGIEGGHYRKTEAQGQDYERFKDLFDNPEKNKVAIWDLARRMEITKDEDFKDSRFATADDLMAVAIKKLGEDTPGSRTNKNARMVVDEILKEKPDLARRYNLLTLDALGRDVRSNEVAEFETYIYEISRALSLAEKLQILSGRAEMWDGPRWKKDAVIPPEMGPGNVPGGLIQLNPMVTWEVPIDQGGIGQKDPSTGKEILGTRLKIELNLRTDRYLDPDEPGISVEEKEFRIKKKAALKDLQGDKAFSIGFAWHKAWRLFYKNNWDLIDFANSAGGVGPDMSKSAFHFPASLMRYTEANPQIPLQMRSRMFLGIVSLTDNLLLKDEEEMVYNWYANIKKLKAWQARLALDNQDRLKAKLREVFSKSEAYVNPIKALGDLVPELKKAYINPDRLGEGLEDPVEVGYVLGDLIEGVVEFNLKYRHKKYPQYHNADAQEIDRFLNEAIKEGLISKKSKNKIEDKYLGPEPIRSIRKASKMVDLNGALFGFMGDFFKAINPIGK